MKRHYSDPAACQHHWKAKKTHHYCILNTGHTLDHQCECGLEPSGQYGAAVPTDSIWDRTK